MTEAPNREQWLLLLFGLLPIAIVAWIQSHYAGPWVPAALNLAFAVVFLSAGLREALHLPQGYGPAAMVVLLGLNLLSLALYPQQVTLILAVVLAASAPYFLSPGQSWLLLAVGNALFAAILLANGGISEGSLPGLMTLLALQGFAVSSSLARHRDEESRLALARQNRELQAARAALALKSQAEERLRIAGALHDGIGHGLTALRLQLEALSHEAPAELRDQVTRCQRVAGELLEGVRTIVRDMPDAGATDFDAALRELAAAMPGLQVTVDPQLPTVDSRLAQQLVYCFQEAIHNAVRHGGADRITIGHRQGSYLIDDNGRGLRGRTPRPGFGLRNIRQRLSAFGGEATLEAAPRGSGCRLRLSLPAGERP